MNFEGSIVPGGEWVEIVQIRNKDGSELAEDNWRRNMFGRITLCWVAGGFRRRGLFFKGKIYMSNGKPLVISLDSSSWCSTTQAQPVEVEPGVYDMVTNTSIYRLRLLDADEAELVTEEVRTFVKQKLERVLSEQDTLPIGGDGLTS